MYFVFWIFFIWATDTEISVKKQCLGTSWMGWGPVDWVGRVLPEAKFENKWTLFFYFFIWATDTEISVKKQFLGTSWMGWGPVDWSSQNQNSKINGLSFLNFLIWATDTEISVKTVFGDQLSGLGTSWMGWGPVDWSSQNQNSKINGLSFLNFLDLSDRYWDFCKKQFLGTSWMGWGPVEWVGDQLTGPPRSKIRK